MAESGNYGSPENPTNPTNTPGNGSIDPIYTSRRARRAAEAAQAKKHPRASDARASDVRPAAEVQPAEQAQPAEQVGRSVARTSTDLSPAPRAVQVKGGGRVPAQSVSATSTGPGRPKARKNSKRGVLNVVVMTFAAGLVATMALPAYAFNPNSDESKHFGTSAIDGMKEAQSQTVKVDKTAAETVVKRDPVDATTKAELEAKKAAIAAKKAEAERERVAQQFAAYSAGYSGPSIADFLASPPNPNFSLPAVFATAKQYIGTPYVYGGATPAGFDCSGYVMYVYAQFGIGMPHSVSGQAAMGTRISMADAQPGDLVVMSGIGHIGFYAGNGNIMDAPDVGRSISIRPIWTDNFTIVRIGI